MQNNFLYFIILNLITLTNCIAQTDPNDPTSEDPGADPPAAPISGFEIYLLLIVISSVFFYYKSKKTY